MNSIIPGYIGIQVPLDSVPKSNDKHKIKNHQILGSVAKNLAFLQNQ